MFKVNNKDTPEQSQGGRSGARRCSGVFTVNLEHISHLFLVLLFLTSNK